jgi:hypothetical protein
MQSLVICFGFFKYESAPTEVAAFGHKKWFIELDMDNPSKDFSRQLQNHGVFFFF